MKRLADIPLKTRVVFVLVLLHLLLALQGAVAFIALREAMRTPQQLFADKLLPVSHLRAVEETYTVTVPAIVRRTIADESISGAEGAAAMATAVAKEAAQWEVYKQTHLTPEEKTAVAKLEPALAKTRARLRDVQMQLSEGRLTDAGAVDTRVRDLFEPTRGLLASLIRLQVTTAQEELGTSHARSQRLLQVCVVAAALSLVGLLAGWLLWRAHRRTESRTTDRLRQFYVALSETSRHSLSAFDSEALFKAVCKICVTTGHAEVALIQSVQDNVSRRVAVAGAAEQILRHAPASWRTDTEEARGNLTWQVLDSGEPAISNDAKKDPRLAPWYDWCVETGVSSIAVFPLKQAGACVGVLLLFSKRVNFFDDALTALLSEMTNIVSFALDNAERETARRLAHDQAEQGRELFGRLFHAAPAALAVVSAETQRIVEVNEHWCTLYGIEPDEARGRTAEELGMGVKSEERTRFYANLLAAHRIRGVQTFVKTRDGERKEVLVDAELIEYLGARCALLSTVDLTAVNAAQRARQEQVRAESANQAKTQFLSQMSHELRTPLNAILSYGQMLSADADGNLKPRQADWARLITQAGWHLLALVNDVLDISRIEAGNLDLVAKPVDVRALLDEVQALSVPSADTSGIQLNQSYRGVERVAVTADARRLQQVLINLLSNAIKYNRPGGSVDVTVEARDQEVEIDVVDTGLGMSEEQLSHLFEPFNRLGHERGRIEGTGIGLALSRQLVEAMGGSLTVRSKEGQGTAICVKLARCALEDAPAAPAIAPPPVDEHHPKGVVLYIEDNPVNQLIVEQMLLRWEDVHFLHAEDGTAGLEMAADNQPDLVLLDMQLPDMTGFDVLRALRSQERTKHLQVVALSASAMPEDVAQAMALGAVDYWTKPLDLNQFLAGVSEMLRPVEGLARSFVSDARPDVPAVVLPGTSPPGPQPPFAV
jgi:PAS domain S-box-containing protein